MYKHIYNIWIDEAIILKNKINYILKFYLIV
jgi:hypothetical protein